MECSFRSWIFGILYRLSTSPSRFTTLPRKGSVDLHEDLPDRLDADPFTRASARDLLRRVESSMERLPLRQRAALHLRSVEGWSYQEIAVALESSEGSTRNAVMQARQSLRQRLGDLL